MKFSRFPNETNQNSPTILGTIVTGVCTCHSPFTSSCRSFSFAFLAPVIHFFALFVAVRWGSGEVYALFQKFECVVHSSNFRRSQWLTEVDKPGLVFQTNIALIYLGLTISSLYGNLGSAHWLGKPSENVKLCPISKNRPDFSQHLFGYSRLPSNCIDPQTASIWSNCAGPLIPGIRLLKQCLPLF